jgi:general L-amino acid transport system permease protein
MGRHDVIQPEFMALLVALSTVHGVVHRRNRPRRHSRRQHGADRGGLALGLRPSGPTLRLVVIPQAMRIIIPPLTSQYLNLTKNSSLAVAIAYPELTSVFAGTALNQTGQAVEIISLTMLTYLAISLLTSLFMNWYNSRVALVER